MSHETTDVRFLVLPLVKRAQQRARAEIAGIPIAEVLAEVASASMESIRPGSPTSYLMTKEPTIVFTDIVNSTKLWTKDPIQMREASKVHNTAVRDLLEELGGYEVKTEGDAFMIVFYDEARAAEFGVKIHLRLVKAPWQEAVIENNPLVYSKKKLVYKGLQIRVGISKGPCVIENDPVTKRLDFYGKTVIQGARLCNLACGGETFISESLYHALRESKTSRACIVIERGIAALNGLESEPCHIYEILHRRLVPRLLLRSPIGLLKNPWLAGRKPAGKAKDAWSTF